MGVEELQERLAGAARRGDRSRCLRLADRTVRLSGLDSELETALSDRWGPFLEPSGDESPVATVRLVEADPEALLDAPTAGEIYRVEALGAGARSYHFALLPAEAEGEWSLGLADGGDEPASRSVENALRALAAHLALDRGGIALHGAGVVRDGRAWIFAGPSRAGKSTAVELSGPVTPLGDDFAMVLPGESGWYAPPLPFDNSEAVRERAPEPLYPLAGVWRLFQGPEHRVERLDTGASVASLLSCAAMPWIMPARKVDLMRNAAGLVEAGRFAHLHFSRDPGFWKLLADSAA